MFMYPISPMCVRLRETFFARVTRLCFSFVMPGVRADGAWERWQREMESDCWSQVVTPSPLP